ncbi:presenilin family intramembrane aspartyl protease [Halogeometricum sp. S1BR25-6]|uniref:Presenilin family intramembrane aspartyl protease n=1 Tax=Halogeometricum salsisoli TaxID=2950536 RepID=A0ABU2GCQ9_9EURY|nr:presenilin family intramembrane aspartyl protease PSH [Halogeometricum sp. S1BR25-6]MDS0298251.1 presenilin family intramembrane aspartyl protease [Halogeometricum sp. S1BR25-6]
MRKRVAFAVGLAALVFLLVQLGALALVPTFYDAGYQTVEDPTDPTNSLAYLAAILVATGVMLAAFKYDFDWAVRALVVVTSGMLSWYVFSVFLPGLVAVAAAVGVSAALVAYPEWYVIDAAGVLMGAGAAALFGISFGLLPAVVLLVALAVYDAVSVYGTKHMLDLAEGVMDLRIPVVLVIPTTLSYSLLDDDFGDANDVHEGADATADRDADPNPDGGRDAGTDIDEDLTDDDVRDAFFIGLGDAVMPTVMVASGAFFLPRSLAPSLGVGFLPALTLPALTAMIGTFVGLFALLWLVLKGRAHAGLPLLNGGTIGGYLVGALLSGVPLLTALGL